MFLTPWLWAIFTVMAAGGQTMRNAMQKELTATLGTVGATHVRFLFGLPFAVLFLVVQMLVLGQGLPRFGTSALIWTFFGAMAQIGATALMLAAMKERSFVVTTALIKIEPIWVALLGLVFLGDHISPALAGAILVAVSGVMVMSWPSAAQTKVAGWSMRPVAMGLISGMIFGLSAIGYRGGIKAAEGPSFVLNATTTLVAGLLMQTIILSLYLILRDRKTLASILQAWRPSMFAGFMGAFASQFWFLAFAIESAARVRTLALVEILFAQLVSRRLFSQNMTAREALGIALIVAGVIWLLNI